MLNNCSFLGRVVQKPEVGKTKNGKSICKFTIACDKDYIDKDGQRGTTFIDVKAWAGTAEFACKYFTPGDYITISGRLEIEPYTDKQGNKRKSTYINAVSLGFGGGRSTTATAETQAQQTTDEDFTPIDDTEDLPF